MSAPQAATLLAIRREAGLHHQKIKEVPGGVRDGANQVFTTQRVYLVDRNADDTFTLADVVAYVDDLPVAISAVDGSSGAVTLTVAPASGTAVKLTYAYSVLSDVEATQYRKEATDWLRTAIRSQVPPAVYDAYTADTYPSIFSTIVRLYCAGLLLIRDYGSSADTDLTSKDGYKKLQLAKSMLNDWLMETADDSETATPVTGSMKTDGNLFPRQTDLDGTLNPIYPDTDEFFHKGS